MNDYIGKLFERYPDLASCRQNIYEAYAMLKICYRSGGKVLIGGNGGSCADGEHMVGELMKSFKKRRRIPAEFEKKLKDVDDVRSASLAEHLEGAFTALTVTNHPGLTTAFANDQDGTYTFAQQVYGYGRPGDVFIAISTSGNSENVVLASIVARAAGLKVLLLTGGDGGKLLEYADCAVIVPFRSSYEVQERHMPIYHALCLQLEEEFF